MTGESRPVIKQGYIKWKSRGILKRWRKKWAILHDFGIKGDKRLELYDSEKASQKARNCIIISLKDIADIAFIEESHKSYYVFIICKNGSREKFCLSSQHETKEWYQQLNLICFGSVLGNLGKQHCDKTNIEEKKEDLEDSGNFQEVTECFSVYLQPSSRLQISGDCIFQLTTDSINILDVRSPNITLVSWPLASLRRYGYDSGRFTFEAGRRCDTGEGMFIFRTKDGRAINNLVMKNTEEMAFHLRSSSLSDTMSSNGETMQLRPLPPIPNEDEKVK